MKRIERLGNRWAAALAVAGLLVAGSAALQAGTGFAITPNNASSTTTGYSAGAGSITLATGTGTRFGSPSPTNPLYFSTFDSTGATPYGIYRATGRTGDQLTGLTLLSGTDTTLASGAQVRVRLVDEHLAQFRAAVNALEAATTAAVAANRVYAGPTSGGSAAPSWRALVAGDVPDLSGTYAAKAAGLGSYTFVASANGVPLDSNLTTGGGTDAAPALQALLDLAATLGRVHVIIDGPARINTKLRARSNTTIEGRNGGGLWCAPGIGGPAITNYNHVSGYNGGSPIYDGSTIVDANITVRNLVINGNRAGGASGDTDPRGANGWFIAPIHLVGVDHPTLENVRVNDPCSFGIWLANVLDAKVLGCEVFDPLAATSPSAGRNTDGVHLTGPAWRTYIRNLTIATSDDGFAANADDGWNYDGAYTSTFFANYGYRGPIYDTDVDGIFARNCLSVVRVLPQNLTTVTVDRLSVRNVAGSAYLHPIIVGPVGGQPGGFHRIEFAKWSVNCTGSGYYADISGEGGNIAFRDFLLYNSQVRKGIHYQGGTIWQLIVSGWIVGQSNNPDDEGPFIDILNASVPQLIVSGNTIGRLFGLSVSTQPIVNINTSGGGTVGALAFNGNVVDGFANLVVVAGGTLTSCSATGNVQTNPGVGGAAFKQTGGTWTALNTAGNTIASPATLTSGTIGSINAATPGAK